MSVRPRIPRGDGARSVDWGRSVGLGMVAAGSVAQIAAATMWWRSAPGTEWRHTATWLFAASIVIVALGTVTIAGVPALVHRLMTAGNLPRRTVLTIVAVVGASMMIFAGGVVIGGARSDRPPAAVPSIPSSTTAVSAAPTATSTATTGQLGAIIASQGRGSNSPAPTIDGVTFPNGSSAGRGHEPVPWLSSPTAGTSSATTLPAPASPQLPTGETTTTTEPSSR